MKPTVTPSISIAMPDAVHPPAAEGQRLLAYCHEGAGVGHLRRTLTICTRLGEVFPSMTFLIVTGTPFLHLFGPLNRFDWVKLPSIRKSQDGSYAPRCVASGSRHMIRWRAAMLRDTVKGFEPTMVLVDKAPLGVCGEMAQSLRWLRKHRPDTRLVCGLRDIEDEPQTTMTQWAELGVPAALKKLYDEVWVYGCRDLFDVGREYELSAQVREKMHYTGYISRLPDSPHPSAMRSTSAADSKEIVVTVGGGTDGDFLIRTYLESAAQQVAAAGFHSTVITGPDMPRRALQEIELAAGRTSGVQLLEFDADLPQRLSTARLIVTMGGYNTLCEAAACRRPTLVIPRTVPRLEQVMRARLWQERELVDVIDPDSLTAASLAKRVLNMATTPPKPPAYNLDMAGLDRVVERTRFLLQPGSVHAAALRV